VGCAWLAPVGPIINIGIFWMNREAHKYYATPMDEINVAIRVALNDLEMMVSEDYMDDEVRVLKVDENDRFRIRLEPARHNVTKVSILVNTLGDKPYAEMIYRHIDEQPNVEQFTSVTELQTALREPRRRRK
jgi:hypothetical protein